METVRHLWSVDFVYFLIMPRFLSISLQGARVAQYCGRSIHTKITSHPSWGKAQYYYDMSASSIYAFFTCKLISTLFIGIWKSVDPLFQFLARFFFLSKGKYWWSNKRRLLSLWYWYAERYAFYIYKYWMVKLDWITVVSPMGCFDYHLFA